MNLGAHQVNYTTVSDAVIAMLDTALALLLFAEFRYENVKAVHTFRSPKHGRLLTSFL